MSGLIRDGGSTGIPAMARRRGTSPGTARSSRLEFAPGGRLGPEQVDGRAAAVTYAAVAAFPRDSRRLADTVWSSGGAARLQRLLPQWAKASRLGPASFAAHSFGRGPDSRVVQALRMAAERTASASGHEDLRAACGHVADAAESVGLGNWNRFLADAEDRADDPATRAAVAAAVPPPSAEPAPAARSKAAAAPVVPAPGGAPAGVAAEPEHGKVWWWLHGLGLAKTRHEQAIDLRRAMGSQGGLVYLRDGAKLDVDAMSDDEVLALDKETRGQRHTPLLGGAVAPFMTPWGYNNTKAYRQAMEEIMRPGTHTTLNGRVPTREAERMIKEGGGFFDRAEPGHPPGGRSTHHEYHINYRVPGKNGLEKTTVIVQPWKEQLRRSSNSQRFLLN